MADGAACGVCVLSNCHFTVLHVFVTGSLPAEW